jgi:hypothetical protein
MKSKLLMGFFLALGIIFNPAATVAQCPSLGVLHTQSVGEAPAAVGIQISGEEVKFLWPAGSASASLQFTATAPITYYIYGSNGALYASGPCSGPFSFPCGALAPGEFFIVRFCDIASPTNIIQIQALSGGPLALVNNYLSATATEEGIELTYHPTDDSVTKIFRSQNGQDFVEIGTTTDATYLDKDPLIGPNYYRVENKDDQSKVAVTYWTITGPLRIVSANPAPVGTPVATNVSATCFFTDINGRIIMNPGTGIFCVCVEIDDQKYFNNLS